MNDFRKTLPVPPNREVAKAENERRAIAAHAWETRRYYDEYLKRGFTAEQAFELTKHRVSL